MTNYDFGAIPASDADRDRARSMLQSALSSGRISQDEFQRRHSALQAAQTYGQLGSLTSDLTSGGPASSAGGQGNPQASGFNDATPASGLGTQGPLGFQSGAGFGSPGNPGPGSPIGQQPGAPGGGFPGAQNQFGNQPNLGAQGFPGAQNQFGPGPNFGGGPNFGNGPNFGAGPGQFFPGAPSPFGNQANPGTPPGYLGNPNPMGYQDPNQPGFYGGNAWTNGGKQNLLRFLSPAMFGTFVDRPNRRLRSRFGRYLRVAIWLIGIGVALYFGFGHHFGFTNCNGDCGDGG